MDKDTKRDVKETISEFVNFVFAVGYFLVRLLLPVAFWGGIGVLVIWIVKQIWLAV